MPEPIIEPTTSMVASKRPMRRRGAPAVGMEGRDVTSRRARPLRPGAFLRAARSAPSSAPSRPARAPRPAGAGATPPPSRASRRRRGGPRRDAPPRTAARTAQPGSVPCVQSRKRQAAASDATSGNAAPPPPSQSASSRIPGVSTRRAPDGRRRRSRRVVVWRPRPSDVRTSRTAWVASAPRSRFTSVDFPTPGHADEGERPAGHEVRRERVEPRAGHGAHGDDRRRPARLRGLSTRASTSPHASAFVRTTRGSASLSHASAT